MFVSQVQADGADEGCVTFVMHDEDHTLGNSLRYMVMKKSVASCLFVCLFTFLQTASLSNQSNHVHVAFAILKQFDVVSGKEFFFSYNYQFLSGMIWLERFDVLMWFKIQITLMLSK